MSQSKEKGATEKIADSKKICGIIMPIASTSGYPTDHWKDVLMILTEAINETEFEPRLVSDDIAIGLIHERIVTNIYTNDIVICDVSSKNPNVMFELGLRLAFDKPTIIIKDELTGYSFDTGVIEHIPYPSSLRFSQVVKFKSELIKRINATFKKSQEEPNYSPFLKSFGKTIVPASIQLKEVTEGKYILSMLEKIGIELQQIRSDQFRFRKYDNTFDYDIDLNKYGFVSSLLKNYSKKMDNPESMLYSTKILDLIASELAKDGVKLSSEELKLLAVKYFENLRKSNNSNDT